MQNWKLMEINDVQVRVGRSDENKKYNFKIANGLVGFYC